jgi:2-keto-4-pentenoate hydratase/2-oxohepta-3-ene-1,7-dioic acid hydratase in catechol pathway
VAHRTEAGLVDLNQADPAVPHCIKALLKQGPEGIDRARAASAQGRVMPHGEAEMLPPVPSPEKIICVGLNYADHAKESGMDRPAEPVLFNKFPSAAAAHGQPVLLPRASNEVDFEAELVAVIGMPGRNIPRESALRHVAGYCCGNDISARDWQLRKPGGQWLLGKSFDTFAPFGPEIVTADEVGDPGRLSIQMRLNGQVMQDSSTEQFLFPVAELVAYVSSVCTLAPGDLLFTGTPPGVGFARKPPVFLRSGDNLEVEIEKLGVLRNVVADAE